MIAALAFLIGLGICPGGHLHAHAADDAADRLAVAVDKAFRPLLASDDVPGLAVGVTARGRRFFFNFGVASRETKKPVTQNTLFEIGSLSKTFTATLGAEAVAKGAMSLDQHPGAFLPALRGTAVDKATLRDLGTFTAGGLPLQVPAGVRNDAELVSWLKRWKPEAEPGVLRRYSNVSIGLFGYLSGLALKRDFADAMEQDLIPKLGLSSTYVHVPQSRADAYAWGYDKSDRPIRVTPGVFDAEAYGIKSTTTDLLRFLEINMPPESLEAPLRPSIEGTHIGYAQIDGMTQGLGWESYPFPVTLERLLAGNSTTMIMESRTSQPVADPKPFEAPRLFNKTGSTNGFAAYAVFVPAKQIGIIMLANKNIPIPARIKAAYAVLEALSSDADAP